MDGMDKQESGTLDAKKTRTPPYISYKTFLNLLGEMKEHGLPPQIDRSVMKKYSGGLQGQILLALRSLDLIDGANKPNAQFQQLVDAHGTDDFQHTMIPVLKRSYPYFFMIDLTTATPSMFDKAFKDSVDVKEDVFRKCRTFFLHAAKDIGIPLGSRIASATFARTKSTTTRKPKPPSGGDGDSGQHKPPADPKSDTSIMSQLLTKFPNFDPSWSDELKAKWFEGFEKFMSSAKT